nr:hypothetical protein Q903MT_gene3053 [Picea sitchensis]
MGGSDDIIIRCATLCHFPPYDLWHVTYEKNPDSCYWNGTTLEHFSGEIPDWVGWFGLVPALTNSNIPTVWRRALTYIIGFKSTSL